LIPKDHENASLKRAIDSWGVDSFITKRFMFA